MMDTSSDMPIERPGYLSLLGEMRTPLEFPKLAAFAPALLAGPRGDGRPVLLTPGYLASDLSMQPLATYLRLLGYAADPWGLGRNGGDVEGLVDAFGAVVSAKAQDIGRPVTVIGWSLGGVIARETARLYSDVVEEVITIGSPIVGGPKYTVVGQYYATRFDLDLDDFEREVHARNQMGLRQPVTSIYSKGDGVVAWRASIDTYNPQARNILVRGPHFGLGVNAQVWRAVAKTLARAQRRVS